MARGRKKQALRKTASRFRKKMIRSKRKRVVRRNRFHVEDLLPKPRASKSAKQSMPAKYREMLNRVAKSRNGKKALSKYRRFIGIPHPTEMRLIGQSSKGKLKYLIGMGRSPAAFIADGPKGAHRKIRKLRGPWIPSFTSDGKKIILLRASGRGPVGKSLKFVGYAPETHYILTAAQEKAGSFKRGKHWVHKHDDERGKWPKVYKDSSGNLVYGKGTYHVGAWIRR
jgi:hypothetical protein